MTGKIVITTSSFGKYDPVPLELCRAQGLEVVVNPHGRQVTSKELVELAFDAIGLIAGTEQIGKEELDAMPNLKIISRVGVGVDNIDLYSARQRGIQVFNTPFAPIEAVAELTVGLILNLIRQVHVNDAQVKQGQWKKEYGHLLGKQKVGLVGFGRIGRKVAELLTAFQCDIGYVDPIVKEEKTATKFEDLEKLLKWADIISMHVSGKDILLDARRLALMKKGAWLINISRGGLIDEEALYEALKNGKLSGAAIDVFSKEPYDGPLTKLSNVILTPHVGSYAIEARIEMEKEAVNNLFNGFKEIAKIRHK